MSESEQLANFTNLRIQLEEMIREIHNTFVPRGTSAKNMPIEQVELKLIEAKMWLGKVIGSIEGQRSVDIDYSDNEIKPLTSEEEKQ